MSHPTTVPSSPIAEEQIARSRRVASLLPRHASLALLLLAAIAYCTWVLSLPVFPTQDGPMHLYYVRVMQALLLHQEPGIFARYYTVKHLLPPYSFYYYLLLALAHFVPLIVADKLVICLYVFLFLFGLRFFARSLGPRGDSMALLAAPLVINWPLGMGFINFCLAASFAFWALGLWCRAAAAEPTARRKRMRLGGFVALCFLIMLTHPVPLVGLLAFCAVDLLIRSLRARRADGGERRAGGGAAPIQPGRLPRFPLPEQATALLLALTTLLYVKAFTTSNVVHQLEAGQGTYLHAMRINAPLILATRSLIAFTPHSSAIAALYRMLIVLIFVVPLGMALFQVRRSLRAGEWTTANTLTILCVLLGVAIPILPPDLNSSHYFSQRLVILLWIGVLAAASGEGAAERGGERRRGRAWLVAPRLLLASSCFATLTTAIALHLAIEHINPVAVQIGESERMPLEKTREVALLLLESNHPSQRDLLTYDPFYWVGARYLRRTDSVMYNTPWLDLPILPLGAQAVMPTGKLSISTLEWGVAMHRELTSSAEARRLIFEHVNMVLMNRDTAADEGIDPVLALDPVPGRAWSCAPEGIFTVCRPRSR